MGRTGKERVPPKRSGSDSNILDRSIHRQGEKRRAPEQRHREAPSGGRPAANGGALPSLRRQGLPDAGKLPAEGASGCASDAFLQHQPALQAPNGTGRLWLRQTAAAQPDGRPRDVQGHRGRTLAFPAHGRAAWCEAAALAGRPCLAWCLSTAPNHLPAAGWQG